MMGKVAAGFFKILHENRQCLSTLLLFYIPSGSTLNFTIPFFCSLCVCVCVYKIYIFIYNYFIVQLQLSAFTPLKPHPKPSLPPLLSPHLDFIHVSFIKGKPFSPSPYYPLTPPLRLLSDCS